MGTRPWPAPWAQRDRSLSFNPMILSATPRPGLRGVWAGRPPGDPAPQSVPAWVTCRSHPRGAPHLADQAKGRVSRQGRGPGVCGLELENLVLVRPHLTPRRPRPGAGWAGEAPQKSVSPWCPPQPRARTSVCADTGPPCGDFTSPAAVLTTGLGAGRTDRGGGGPWGAPLPTALLSGHKGPLARALPRGQEGQEGTLGTGHPG